MLFNGIGIVLQTIPYRDKQLICKVFTEHRGLISLMAHVGTSNKSKIKRAQLLPITPIEFQASGKEQHVMGKLIEVRVLQPWKRISTEIVRSCIAVFLNEVFLKVLRDDEGNPELFGFIMRTYQDLDNTPEIAGDFHLLKLIQLSQYLGFFPSPKSQPDQDYFDLMNGVFSGTLPNHPYYLQKDAAVRWQKVIACAMDYCETGFNTAERRLALNDILLFYRLHVPNFNELKSLEVLQDTLHA